MQTSRYSPRLRSLRRSLQQRHLIVLACFLATLSAYVERVGFSIAYTAMATVEKVDEATKGTVLSAFYWGYGVSQVRLFHLTAGQCPAQYKSPASTARTKLTPISSRSRQSGLTH